MMAAVHRLEPPLFGVIDGAQFDDFTAESAPLGLFARSLFLGAGMEAERAGPWLVRLPRLDDVERLLTFAGERPAALVWGCTAGEQALWHHLRTLNQIKMDRVDRFGPPSDIVTFRHWDPRALAIVMPVLTEPQHARVLGPANGAVFFDPPREGGRGLCRLVSPEQADAIRPRGRLHIDAEQVDEMAEVMEARSQRKIGAYLADVAPGEVRAMDASALYRHVGAAQAEARALGLTSERAAGQWAYLALITGGSPARIGSVRDYVARGGATPEANLDRLLHEMGRDGRA